MANEYVPSPELFDDLFINGEGVIEEGTFHAQVNTAHPLWPVLKAEVSAVSGFVAVTAYPSANKFIFGLAQADSEGGVVSLTNTIVDGDPDPKTNFLSHLLG